MVEDSDSTHLQSRLKDLESQLQEVQKRTRDLMSPNNEGLEASEDPRDSMEFRETSSFPATKDPEFPAVRERTSRATGRYDQDVGDLAQSKEIASETGSQDFEEEPARGHETPQQPFYPGGMMPPPSYYPMYPPPPGYYPMPQMNYMQPGMPQQYQSSEASPYWPQRSQPRSQSRSRAEPRQSHVEEELKAEVARLKEQYEDMVKEKDEEIERARAEAGDQQDEGERVASLLRKLRETEDALDYAKKEMEMARNYIEKFKAQSEEKERTTRQKLQDYEQENKFLKEKAGKLETALASERVKANSAVEKVSQSDEALTIFQERLTNTTKDLDEMKRTRLQYIQKYQSDVEALKKEVKLLTNSLEQAHVQLDQARYELLERDRKVKLNSQEQANLEVNRLTQQVHMLQRQLEDTYGKLGIAPKPTRTPLPEVVMDRPAGKTQGGDVEYGTKRHKTTNFDYEAGPITPSEPPTRPGRPPIPPPSDPEPQYEWSAPARKPRTVSSEAPYELNKGAADQEQQYEWTEKPRPRAQSRESDTEVYDPVQALENQLVTLQMEKQQLEGEFMKLPDRARTLQVKKRKEELEARLKVIDANLGSVKGQLRGLKVLHK